MNDAVFKQNAPRFFSRIKKIKGSNPMCWIWDDALHAITGYPKFLLMDGSKERKIEAARAAWIMYRGPLKKGERLLATCGEVLCVNPQHMLISTAGPRIRKNETRTKWQRSVDAFWTHTVKGDSKSCWLYEGTRTPIGYGLLRTPYDDGKKSILAHRFSLLLHRPNEAQTSHCCHKCDVPSCVNPDHLYWGNGKSNMEDRSNRGRCNVRKGDDSPCSKLSSEDVLKIVEIYNTQYLSSIKIASLFNVHPGTIQLILNGKNWSHLTGIEEGTNNNDRKKSRRKRTVLLDSL